MAENPPGVVIPQNYLSAKRDHHYVAFASNTNIPYDMAHN